MHSRGGAETGMDGLLRIPAKIAPTYGNQTKFGEQSCSEYVPCDNPVATICGSTNSKPQVLPPCASPAIYIPGP